MQRIYASDSASSAQNELATSDCEHTVHARPIALQNLVSLCVYSHEGFGMCACARACVCVRVRVRPYVLACMYARA